MCSYVFKILGICRCSDGQVKEWGLKGLVTLIRYDQEGYCFELWYQLQQNLINNATMHYHNTTSVKCLYKLKEYEAYQFITMKCNLQK